jgi:hypothetical protein
MAISNICKKIGVIIVNLLAVVLLQAAALSVQAQSAKEQISTEIVRLQQILASLNLSEVESKPSLQQLNRTTEALQSGYAYLSLYYLQGLETELLTLEYLQTKAEVAKQGVDGFEKEWRRLGEQLSEGEKMLSAQRLKQTPVVVKGLAEISQSQIRPYYKSGRLFGLNTTVKEGLYYLGRAPAHLNFAIYCQKLNFSESLSTAKLHSLERQLQQIENETLKAFQEAKTAAEQQRYIPVNSSLKIAWELNRAGSFNGALLQYLDVSLKLGLIKESPFDEQRFLALQKQSESLRLRLASNKSDFSIGLLYWQMAQQALQRYAADQTDSDTAKRAAVIVEQVLPRYFKYLAEGKQ